MPTRPSRPVAASRRSTAAETQKQETPPDDVRANATGRDRGPGNVGREAQFDLWPPRVQVEALDVHAVVGKQTRVVALYRVRYEREPGVHQVFLDHHGWYCADHGPRCKAVRDVTARHQAQSAP